LAFGIDINSIIRDMSRMETRTIEFSDFIFLNVRIPTKICHRQLYNCQVITVCGKHHTLTDGAPDDTDSLVNDQIFDPGGPALTTPPPASHPMPVGGELLPTSLVRVLAPWIAALLILTIIPFETLRPRRRNRNQ